MKENSTATVLREIGEELSSAYNKSLRLCLDELKCETCPISNKNMKQYFGTECLGPLLLHYSVKLRWLANTLEEKGE